MTYTSGKLTEGIQLIIDQRDHFYQALLYIQRHLVDTVGLTYTDNEYIDQALMAIDLALMELPVNEKTIDTDHNTSPCD